jgi:hypothetical protein
MSNARTDYSLESLAASSATTLASAENTSPRPNLRGHLPVLDGVRGLAILMVLLLVEIRLNAKNQLTAARASASDVATQPDGGVTYACPYAPRSRIARAPPPL